MEENIFNVYGFVSGGYLFDRMDRLALDYLFGLSKSGKRDPETFLFTKNAEITFMKQCCSKDDLAFYVHSCYKLNSTEFLVIVIATSFDSRTMYARGSFTFKEKAKNYCEVKNG